MKMLEVILTISYIGNIISSVNRTAGKIFSIISAFSSIGGIARGKIGPQHFVQAVLSQIGNVAEDEWLN